VRSVFRPSISLMSRLRIPQKFIGLGLIYLVAVAGVGYSLYLQLSQVIGTSRQELEGIALIKPMTRTMQLLQEHRGLTSGLLGGDESLREIRAGRQVELNSLVASLAAKLSLQSQPEQGWPAIQGDWEAIRQGALGWSASRSFNAHSRLLEKLQTLRRHVADHHWLSLDQDVGAHYLLDTAIVELPEALEKIARIRGLGTGILASRTLSPEQKLQMHSLLTELQGARAALAFNVDKTARYSPGIQEPLAAAFAEFDRALIGLLDEVRSDILFERFESRPDAFFMAATVVVDKGYQELYRTLLPTSEGLISDRIYRAEQQLFLAAGTVLLLMLIVCYFFAGIYFSTVDSIQALARAAQQFASGDISQRVKLDTRDELRQVGTSFNAMADGFAALLAARTEDEQRLRAIVGSALDAVIQMDAAGKISGWSRRAEECFGWSREEAIGRQLHETIIPPRYREAHVRGFNRFLTSGEGPVLNTRVEIEGLHRAGHELPIELSISAITTGRGIEFSAFVRDISARRKAEAELRIAAIAFESEEGIAITDAKGATLNVNQSFTKITGYSLEEMVGRSPDVMKSDRQAPGQIHAMRRALSKNGAWQGELWGRRKSGEDFPEWIRITAVSNEAGRITNYVVSFSDITQRKHYEETIHKLAFYDALTGQPNRTLLMDRLKQAMNASHRNRSFGAVLFIDLDNFKTLNDTLGHDKGDLLLQQAAQRLVACVREGDTVARLGGDEFVVVLGGLDASAVEAANQTETVGEKVLAALHEPYQLGHVTHRSSASIGATLYRGHETSIDDLLKQADLAMYKSKETGRNSLHFFDPAMQTAVLERAALEEGLRKAIVENQFVVHYQPQVDSTGRVVGAEALVRWSHPSRGMVSPAEFIPLAEETGLILPLGHWVMETVCSQLAAWATRLELVGLSIAVNVSARQFSLPNFVEQVTALVDHHGIPAGRLKLELTESLLLENAEAIIAKMVALKARGVGFSLDDFGTGYSSLSYLKRLPLDQLKIDQSFVRDVLVDPNDAAIARTIVALGQSLGLAVIAEGVETSGQRDFLASQGCLTYQGYLFSRPVPVDPFERYVQEAHAGSALTALAVGRDTSRPRQVP
jgi:diguanylate cyclase (GGDEF)-like protein/PAS domain S-box-containing protein